MSVALKLTGHHKDLGGGFMVRRLLPSAQQQSVGPFIFFDHFGPVTEQPGTDHDVRPHPHIGLATVTYLFEGAMMHRDSIGSAQRIEPGAINWMTAGRGIVHSERAPDDLRGTAYVNHGLQLWAALPSEFEETAPGFSHTPAESIPEAWVDGAMVRILVGEAFGKTSPVKTYSHTLYLDVALKAGTPFTLPPLAEQMALYAVDGDLQVDGQSLPMHTLATLSAGAAVLLEASAPTRLVVIGGDALDAHRFMWWNFVSSRKERIVQASEAWEAQSMGEVPGETEFIPLPERKFSAG
ncbi:MAG: pirin family protein [Polaromonas sp.]|uniref:pirin family protein n=1 Tax=Polaromonas sp. TaxID=1869339 RepID=UPI003265E371